MQLPKLPSRLLAICILATLSLSANAQDFGGQVVRDPTAGLAIYDFHFDGVPRNHPYLLLPPFGPSLQLPGSLIPWAGIYQLPAQDPIFSFNLQLRMTDIGQVILSDGAAPLQIPFPIPNPQPNPTNVILPGVTCLLQGGCDPIAFVLPTRFQPINPEGFEPFLVDVELKLTHLQSTPFDQGIQPPPFVDLGFVDPPLQVFDPFPRFDPNSLLPPLQPDLLISPPLPALPPLDPLGSGQLQIPIPPDPALTGVSLSLQSLVSDPSAGVLRISSTQQGQNIQIGNSLVMTTSVIPEPQTLSLMIFALAGMIYLRRRQHLKV